MLMSMRQEVSDQRKLVLTSNSKLSVSTTGLDQLAAMLEWVFSHTMHVSLKVAL